ncbi:hypothetical protein D1AOALGA4SA_3370 [Olavius algarvensis Delta 1 endosymbiont]|nr:hypothetical protein D1AOALGA4SA_3370 [Olavius algarvensis Delta 1 endosymbiont]
MNIVVSELSRNDRKDWEDLYYGYADFYEVPMIKEILDAVWSWIFDDQSKDPGPEDPALSSPQRGGVYLGLQME